MCTGAGREAAQRVEAGTLAEAGYSLFDQRGRCPSLSNEQRAATQGDAGGGSDERRRQHRSPRRWCRSLLSPGLRGPPASAAPPPAGTLGGRAGRGLQRAPAASEAPGPPPRRLHPCPSPHPGAAPGAVPPPASSAELPLRPLGACLSRRRRESGGLAAVLYRCKGARKRRWPWQAQLGAAGSSCASSRCVPNTARQPVSLVLAASPNHARAPAEPPRPGWGGRRLRRLVRPSQGRVPGAMGRSLWVQRAHR